MTRVAEPDKYVPRHRQDPARRASRAAVRTMFVLSSAAVVGTGVAVAGGSVSLSGPPRPAGDAVTASAELADPLPVPSGEPAAMAPSTPSGPSGPSGPSASSASSASAAVGVAPADLAAEGQVEQLERRSAPVSRSDRRGVADPRKQTTLALAAGANAMTRTEDASDDDPREVAAALVGDATQFDCLDSLWTKESGWRVTADNPTSSAYGIPQALPGSKMSSFGADWATNPVTQIRWGLDYIEDRYGSPCGAWAHSVSNNWY